MKSIVVATALLSAATATLAQSAFTYQGRLDLNGEPTTGIFDMQFKLFDDATRNNQQGSTVCVDDVVVAPDGTFTTALDFGLSTYAHPLFLEISVREGDGVPCATPSGYETLTRIEILSAPFAVRAVTADDAATLEGQSSDFFRNAANLNAGVIPDARIAATVARTNVATTFTAPITFTNPASSFIGSGSGLLSLNADHISSGVLAINLGGTGSDTSGATTGQVLKFAGGRWIPGADNDTTYSAGSGLTLIGTVFSVPSQGIVAGMLADNSVDTFAIAPGAILASDISDSAISTSKIANNAVTGIKVAANSISASHIVDGTIGNADLQSNSISGTNIIDATITNLDLAVGAVNTFTILDSTITSADIALDTITAADIAPDAVGASEIAAGAVGTSELAASSVTNAILANDAASLARVSGGAMSSSSGRIGINGAPGTQELTVNGRIDASLGLTSAGTVTAAEFVHVNPFPRTYSLGPYDATIRDGGVSVGDENGNGYTGEPFLFNNSLFVGVECVLPVHLPDGAVVTQFTLLAQDNIAGNITAQLLRRAFNNSPGGTMAQAATSGEVANTVRSFTDTTISAPTIDNDAFMYYVRLSFSPSDGQLNFKGAIINYTVARPLP